MEYLILFIIFLFGTLFGSFFTVIGLRLPKKENFTTTRSHCDICKHELKLYEMIPIFSYIIQRGRCRYCHNKIDIISTIIELFTGILFATCYYSFGLTYEFLIGIGIISMLMIIIVSDFTYLIIPDEVLIFSSIYFIIIYILNLGLMVTLSKILSGLFLFSLMYLMMIIGTKILKKECLGGGDIKRMFVFGLILDPLLGTVSIFIGSLIALPVSLIILYKNKEKQIPFGPFLLIALALIYFTKITPNELITFLRGY